MKYFDEIPPEEQEPAPCRKVDYRQTEFPGDPMPLWWHVSRLSPQERRELELRAFQQMFPERFQPAAPA